MEIFNAYELENIQMELFMKSREYKKEGDLRRCFGCLSISKYINKKLNHYFNGVDKPNPVYDLIVERAIELGEISLEKAYEFDKYGRRKASFLIILSENPQEIIFKARLNAQNFRTSLDLFGNLNSIN